MANYLKPQSPLQHKDGDYFYPLTTIDQIITDNDTRLNAELISIDLKDSVESDKVVLGTQAIPISIQEGGTNANNAAEARENLGITPENIGAISMELLWENASPTSEFAAQTVTLDASVYQELKIEFYSRAQNDRKVLANAPVGKPVNAYDMRGTTSTAVTPSLNWRSVEAKTNSVVFDDCCNKVLTEKEKTVTNDYMIPFRIYSIKGVTV